MSKRSQTLRALVTERLTAAAEEIFELVERTILEYEEELCRCKAENRRNQQLLEENRRNQQLHRTDSQKPFLSYIPETLQRNEARPEHGADLLLSVKSEEHGADLLLSVKSEEHGADLLLSVKSEEQPSPIQPGQTEDDDWEPAAGVSTAQTQTAAGGDRYSQVRIDSSPAARDSAPFNTSDTGKHECSFCSKRFITKQRLQVHTRVHTGERPFSCTVCNEAFAAKGHLKDHMRVHTGEKPYSCSICERSFARQFTLQGHMRTHTGERPYSCSECEATFAQRPHLTKHMLKHTYGHT